MTDDEEHGHQCCAGGLCIICYPEVPEHYLVHDSIAYLALSLIYRFVLCYTGIYRNTRGCQPHSFVLDLQLLYLHQSALRSHSEFGQVFSCHHPHGHVFLVGDDEMAEPETSEQIEHAGQ